MLAVSNMSILICQISMSAIQREKTVLRTVSTLLAATSAPAMRATRTKEQEESALVHINITIIHTVTWVYRYISGVHKPCEVQRGVYNGEIVKISFSWVSTT